VNPPRFAPQGWPVVEPDLVMGYVGPVMVIRLAGGLSAHGFSRYIEEWSRSVDARPTDARVFAMYDLPEWPGMTAVQRREWAAMLKSREDKLRLTTQGMVLATPSVITRGAARAIFWLAPPPYPTAVVDTPEAAFAHIAGRGGPAAGDAAAEYHAFLERHLPASMRAEGRRG
jgi:hypothetical protein